MNRRFKVTSLEGRELSVRFYYGQPNETNPELSYTQSFMVHARDSNGRLRFDNTQHPPQPIKEEARRRFVTCRIEEPQADGSFNTVAEAIAICNDIDRFCKREGRVRSVRRAVEKITDIPEAQREIRVKAVGDEKAVSRYNETHREAVGA